MGRALRKRIATKNKYLKELEQDALDLKMKEHFLMLDGICKQCIDVLVKEFGRDPDKLCLKPAENNMHLYCEESGIGYKIFAVDNRFEAEPIIMQGYECEDETS